MAAGLGEEKTLKLEDINGDTPEETDVLRYTYACRQEAYEAKRERMFVNRKNFDYYNLRADFTHKKDGQSREFLPKQRMSILQLASFLSQTLADAGDWYSVIARPGIEDPKITPHEIKLLMQWALEKQNFTEWLDDSLKLGLIGSLMVSKIGGVWKDAYEYETKQTADDKGVITKEIYKNSKQVWEPKMWTWRQEDYFPDPTGQGLFEVFQIEQDLHAIKKLSEPREDGKPPLYDKAVTDKIVGGFEDLEQVARKARETAQIQTFHSNRKRVRIWECYGTILNPSTGEVIMENAMWTVCNDRFLIQKPIPNPFWHGKVPKVCSAILRVPHSVWHGAFADSMSDLNQAMNELFNLQLDTGMMSTWGIRQMRSHWMADDTKYANGIPPGETIEVNESCPPGAKVLEPVQTAEMSPVGMQVYSALGGEFNQASMTNDLRMGSMPGRDVKATEVVEANQSIGSMLNAIAKIIESGYIMEALKLLWQTIAQHLKDIDREELVSLFGEDRTNQLLAMGAEEIFSYTVKGTRFKVFGISEALSKMKDFRKLTALLQTIGGSEVLMEEFIKKYDFGKLLGKIVRALDIDTEEIEQPKHEQDAMAQQPPGGGPGLGGGGPNVQSQTPQVASGAMAQTGNGQAQPAALNKTNAYANATSRLSGQGG